MGFSRLFIRAGNKPLYKVEIVLFVNKEYNVEVFY